MLTHWQVTEVVPPMPGTSRHWRVTPTGGPAGVIDVVVGDPTSDEVARYPMSGRIDCVTTDLPTVRATNPPSMAARVGGYELALGASHPLLNRIDLIAMHGRELVAVVGTPTRPEYGQNRPVVSGGCEFLAYVHVPRAAAVVMDCHIETDAPVYQEDR